MEETEDYFGNFGWPLYFFFCSIPWDKAHQEVQDKVNLLIAKGTRKSRLLKKIKDCKASRSPSITLEKNQMTGAA